MSDSFDFYTTHKFDRASLEQYEREQAMSLGEDRVRTKFNPSDNSLVAQIKQKSAELIDLVQAMPKPEAERERAEFARLCALASTAYEEAAMWAVKAATS